MSVQSKLSLEREKCYMMLSEEVLTLVSIQGSIAGVRLHVTSEVIVAEVDD